MLTNNEIVLVALESTYRQPAAVTDADALYISDIQFEPNHQLRMRDRPGIKPTFGMLQSSYGGALGRLAGTFELKGSGAAGTAPKVGRILQACGMAETIVPATSVTYSPSSDALNHESATLHYYEGGEKLHVITGCRGSVQLQFTGEALLGTFELIGHIDTDPTDAQPTAGGDDFDQTLPLPFLGAAVDIGGYTPLLDQVAFDPQNAVTMSADVNKPNGFGEVRITNADPTLTLAPESDLVANRDWLTAIRSGTKYNFTTGQIGTTPGNQVSFTAADVYVKAGDRGDREGMRTDELTLHALETAGDDHYALVFT